MDVLQYDIFSGKLLEDIYETCHQGEYFNLYHLLN